MKKIGMLLLLMMLLSLTACDDSEDRPSTSNSRYMWVLVDTEDYEQAEFKSEKEGSEFTYTFDYDRGSFGAKRIYDGETRQIVLTEDYYVHGETYSARCDFDLPPERFAPGENITLATNLTETENTLSGWNGTVIWNAVLTSEEVPFNGTSSEDINLTDSNGNYGHKLDTVEGIASVNTEVFTTAPNGKKGERIVLRTKLALDFLAIGTRYIYELQTP